jgi:hypothetical protein
LPWCTLAVAGKPGRWDDTTVVALRWLERYAAEFGDQ